MELFDAIYSRRSVRKYTEGKIDRKELEKIIDAGIQAPSACNIQGWRFIVVDDSELLKKLTKMGAATFVKNAPQGILVVYDNRTDNLEYMDYLQSAAAAIQNMMLAAHSLGIGSCWVCHLPKKGELRDVFNIPQHYDPIAFVSMGYPEKAPGERPRKHGVDEVVSHNRFDFKEKGRSRIGLGLKRLLRGLYYKSPRFVRRILDPVAKIFEKKFD